MPSRSVQALVRDLRNFERRKEVVKHVRSEIRKPVPQVRSAIKRNALAILPARGGLNKWVASTRVTAAIKVTGRTVKVRLRGGRNSKRSRSDIAAVDRGRVRHPAWGRRGPGQWANQSVADAFFTDPAVHTLDWHAAIDRAADQALDMIRRG